MKHITIFVILTALSIFAICYNQMQHYISTNYQYPPTNHTTPIISPQITIVLPTRELPPEEFLKASEDIFPALERSAEIDAKVQRQIKEWKRKQRKSNLMTDAERRERYLALGK